MSKEFFRKIIVEQFNNILKDELKDQKYEGQKLIIHDSDFDGQNSWIAFNLEGEDSLMREDNYRFLDFNESEFSNWIQENEDVFEYMEKDYDWSPEERRSTPYETFNYKEWKENNEPKNYVYSFLVDMLTNKGIPSVS